MLLNGLVVIQTFFLGAGAYAAALLFSLLAPGRVRGVSYLGLALAAALGSVMGFTALSGVRGLFTGPLAIALLLFVHWSVVRRASPWMRQPDGPGPTLLVYQGEFVPPEAERIPAVHDTVMAHLRTHGIASPAEVEVLILASSGRVTIVRRALAPPPRLDPGSARMN